MNSESNTRTFADDSTRATLGRASPVFAGSMSFEGVSFSVRDKTIIKDVSLTLEAGKTYCLLGSSGSGKTTLLRLAAGIERPSLGRILLDGKEIAGPETFVPPEKRKVGLMFQDFALFPHLTALQNVAFGLTALERGEAHKVARLALARVGLADMEQRYPASLSGGEQQRVALARTIVPRPQIILMDEPFSSLDQQLKEKVRGDTLSVLKETRATSLLVTHDPQEALAFADELFVLRAGQIAQRGKPEDFLNHPSTPEVAQFFRTYNVFETRAENGLATLPFGAVPVAGFEKGRKLKVLVPPGDIRLNAKASVPTAVVTDCRQLGQHVQVITTILSTGERIVVHMNPREALAPGTICGLVLAAENTHVFAM
jgi:iron(III) transport system ATP-binding protein